MHSGEKSPKMSQFHLPKNLIFSLLIISQTFDFGGIRVPIFEFTVCRMNFEFYFTKKFEKIVSFWRFFPLEGTILGFIEAL